MTKEYYQEHKEEVKRKNKEWYKKHKEERKEYNAKWRQEHKEELKEWQKRYNKKHKEEKSEYNKKYKKEHKEELKEYYKNHREERNKNQRRHYNKYKKEINKKERDFYEKGKVFYGYNPWVIAKKYYEKIRLESSKPSPSIVNSNISLETYIAMRAVFDNTTIKSLMMRLYKGSIRLEEINDMIEAAGFDMESEKFKNLIKCVCSSKSVRGFYKNYNGEFK